MDDIVREFLIESNENLDRMDQELVKLESEPSSKDLLGSIFRTIHSIKGSCGFLGFARLERVAHAGENLLSRLRDGELSLTAEMTTGLLAMVDAVRRMLAEIQTSERDGENDYAELLEKLRQLQQAESTGGQTSAAPSPSASGAEQIGTASVEAAEAIARSPGPGEDHPIHQPEFGKLGGLLVERGHLSEEQLAQVLREQERVARHAPTPERIGGLLVERGSIRPEDLAAALREQERGDARGVGEILVSMGACRQQDVLAAQQVLDARSREAGADTVRVGISLLDDLMNLVGELVLARNQLLQFSNGIQDAGLSLISQRMNLIATELQEEVMKTRMQPIGNLWNKLPRTVRDLAQSCGKEVRLETEGQGTELDRTILEAIKDPLTHLVRNAVDHGIEAPEVRARAGKERCGLLRLRAFHQAGQVNLEISDDGAGLDLERIRNKAVESGRISPGQAARLSEKETCNLIFLPGLSTVEKVTNMSGRGVGMDVVKTNVEKIGGTVDLSSNPGQGTTVRVKIPLTLTIIPALMVTCCGERFAIPQVSLLELVRLEGQEVAKRIETVHGVPVHRLRGRLLPLVYLSRELGLAQESGHGDAVNLAVLQADDRQFGLVVDAVIDTQEIVVKPLGRQLKSLATYSGATIMGDGRVALILDIPGLAQRARVAGEARESGSAGKEEPPPAAAGDFDRQSLLLLQNGRNGRVAIPLSLVERLEKVPRSAVEHAGVQEVTQYRGQIMPLIRLSRIVPGGDEADLEQDGCLQVVVCSAGGRNVGLVADRILDIVEEKLLLQPPAQRPGVLGSAVIQQHVTDLLDVPVVLRKTVPGFSDTPA